MNPYKTPTFFVLFLAHILHNIIVAELKSANYVNHYKYNYIYAVLNDLIALVNALVDLMFIAQQAIYDYWVDFIVGA